MLVLILILMNEHHRGVNKCQCRLVGIQGDTSELMLITRSGVTSSYNWQIVVVAERWAIYLRKILRSRQADKDCYLFNINTGSLDRLEYNYVITSTHCDTLGRLSIGKNWRIWSALTPCPQGVGYNSPEKISMDGKYVYFIFVSQTETPLTIILST